MAKFKVVAPYRPLGDQVQAIKKLSENYQKGLKRQTLLGVTGSGKTFTFSKVIEKVGLPTLIMTHNKTLAGQIFTELKGFFPENKVCYYVSYYDYYQPEAYIPQTDTYIEKDADINEDIDRMRLETITSLLTREDVIVVASVSAIYGVGSPKDYKESAVEIHSGMEIERTELLRKFVAIFYDRNDATFFKGEFRVKGEVVDIFPPYENNPIRITMWGDEIDEIYYFNHLTGEKLQTLEKIKIFAAKYFITSEDSIKRAIKLIKMELAETVKKFLDEGKFLEAERIKMRTEYDMEMLKEIGYCQGIENYSRYLTGREEGETPFVLLHYFPENFFTIIDESHISLPQIRGMYNGDRARKKKLVEFGFRLPSALDNRPLYFEEFDALIDKVLYVSATPGDYELSVSEAVVEQIIRPTGLLDPIIEVRPSRGQVYDLMEESKKVIEKGEKVLITTLTKKMAEDLTSFLIEHGLKANYLHSEIDTFDRISILNDLRAGKFDILVGINLLREGLDLPEVSLVIILDADKEGFLRSYRSLIQVAGRAARNANGRVIMYADFITDSMQKAIDETERRRKKQIAFNKKHGIVPTTIKKEIKFESLLSEQRKDKKKVELLENEQFSYEEIPEIIEQLKEIMKTKSEQLLFEEAAQIRDKIFELQKKWEEKLKWGDE